MNFFFDNGFSPRLAKALGELCNSDHHVSHLRDHFDKNTPDDEWIEELSNDGVWVIISKDDRIRRSPVWNTANVTTVFLSRGLQDATFWDMTWKIIKAWPDVIHGAESKNPGTVMVIRHNSTVKFY